MSWWQRNRLRLLLAGLVALALVLFQAGVKAPDERNWFDRALLWLTAPVQKTVVWVVDGVADAWNGYVALVGVAEENDNLRQQLRRLERRLVQSRELEAENRRLRRLLDIKTRQGWHRAVAAKVIAFNTAPVARTIRLDAGRDRGVALDDTVVGSQGLLGRVVNVTASWSEVRLIVDGRSTVSAVDQRSRARAMVRGTGESDVCVIDYLVRTADVKVGDRFVTAVMGGVFTPGVPIGVVSRVTSPKVGVFRQAWLKPVEQFDRLEEVLVLPGPSREQGQVQP